MAVASAPGSSLPAAVPTGTRPRPKTAWSCAFPPDMREAEADGITVAQVVLEIEVDAKGQMTKTRVVRDPGYGFGRAAFVCAKSSCGTL